MRDIKMCHLFILGAQYMAYPSLDLILPHVLEMCIDIIMGRQTLH
jgi:hypothetical protein